MRIWQAHLALAQMIGDPIVVSGSPITAIPDGVRYSKRLRDLYLYRATLSTLEGIMASIMQLPHMQAVEALQRYLPNFIIEDTVLTIGDLEPNYVMPLTRRPVYMLAVHQGNVQFRQESAGRFFAKLYNPYQQNTQDPTYTMHVPQAVGNNPYAKGNLKLRFTGEYAVKWDGTPISALYVPVPNDPSGMMPEDPLDFEPLLFDKILQQANTYAKIDAQEGQ